MEINLFSTSGVLYLLLCLFASINLFYFIFIYGRLFFYKNKAENGETSPVSVIIAARNEAKNLKLYLPEILEQDYDDFEVIVVNDCSYDSSEDVLREYKSQYPHLKVVEIKESDKFIHGKKFAVTMGIKAAKNEILLFTDADCHPLSKKWIRKMQSHYQQEDTQIVLGYSPYQKYFGLLNALIRYETFITALNYFSLALAGIPYMGVGRNLSYKKALFFQQKGFASHLHLKSGDDDLFVNAAATANNTQIEISHEAHTLSEPHTTWSGFIKQKRRHQSVGSYYKKSHQFYLSINPIASIAFYLLLAILFLGGFDHSLLFITFAARAFFQYIIHFQAMRKLKTFDLWLFTPILDLLFHIYLLIIKLIPASAEKIDWK